MRYCYRFDRNLLPIRLQEGQAVGATEMPTFRKVEMLTHTDGEFQSQVSTQRAVDKLGQAIRPGGEVKYITFNAAYSAVSPLKQSCARRRYDKLRDKSGARSAG